MHRARILLSASVAALVVIAGVVLGATLSSSPEQATPPAAAPSSAAPVDPYEPDNPLAQYLRALGAVNGTDSTEGLDGFGEAWAEAAEDRDQRALQDTIVDELYSTPGMELAAETGIVTPLGQAIFWDTMIQHGAGGELALELPLTWEVYGSRYTLDAP